MKQHYTKKAIQKLNELELKDRLHELEVENLATKEFLTKLRKDLYMRAEEDDSGCVVVNVSNFLWQELKERTGDKK